MRLLVRRSRSRRTGVAIAAGLLIFAAPTAAPAAISWSSVLPLEVRAGIDIAFNRCVQGALEIADEATAEKFLSACCNAVDSVCSDACTRRPGEEDLCARQCFKRAFLCNKGITTDDAPGSIVTFEPPVHPTLFPERRIDFCREVSPGGGVSCGVPAANAFCELQQGLGWVAIAFAPDGVAASTADPTWKLGLDAQSISDDEQCEAPSCQGFDLIQCVEITNTYAIPSRFGLRVDACYLVGSQCGEPAADAYCQFKDGQAADALSWSTEVISGDTIYLGEPPITSCNGPGCTALRDVVCYTPQLPVNITGDTDLDGVRQFEDNCPGLANPVQENADGDAWGDICDPQPLEANACSNGQDDDGDGLADVQDPGCLDAFDESETEGLLLCDNGVDDDQDGLADTLDPQCTSPAAANEALPTCGDGTLQPELGETCDDGNASWDDRCSPACRVLAPPGYVYAERQLTIASGDLPAGVSEPDNFGEAMTGIGDVDGDGIEDLVVGHGREDGVAQNLGAVWVLTLNADGSVKSSSSFDPTDLGELAYPGMFFGDAVSPLDDVDGDGVPDLAVGARGYPNGGAVFVVLMNANGSPKSAFRHSNIAFGGTLPIDVDSQLGKGLALLDDLDGDGRRELAVGDPRADIGGTNRGAVYVLYLNSGGSLKAHSRIDATQGSAEVLPTVTLLGNALASVGDVDGNGITDLAVTMLDRFLLLFLEPDGTAGSLREYLPGESGWGGTAGGVAVYPLGDLDEDGIDDFGVPQAQLFSQGRIEVLFPEASGWIRNQHEIDGDSGGLEGPLGPQDTFGPAARIGDLDNDGLDEIAVHSRGNAGTGKIFVLSLAKRIGECGDGIDNDGDGTADLADAACANVFGETEFLATVPLPALPGAATAMLIIAAAGIVTWRLHAQRARRTT